MTTWQDQQQQSRRALRENERAQAQATMSDAAGEETKNPGFDQQIWEESPAPGAREYSANVAPSEEPFRRPRGSGSLRPAPEPAPLESPAYRLRDFSPEPRGSSFSSTQSAPWTPPSPGSEDLSYKTSVDPNRASPQGHVAPISAPPVVVTREDVPLAPAPAESIDVDTPIGHTLTRRELRELRNAAARRETSNATPDVVTPEEVLLTPTPASGPPLFETQFPEPVVVEPELHVPDLADSKLTEPVLAEPIFAEPQLAAGPELNVPELSEPQLVEPELTTPELAESEELTSLVAPAELAEHDPAASATQHSQDDELASAMAEFDKLFQKAQDSPALVGPATETSSSSAHEAQHYSAELPIEVAQPAPVAPPIQKAPAFDWGVPVSDSSAPLREVVTAPEVYEAPAGQWPMQSAADQGSEHVGAPHKRDISSSDAITTSALILPSFSGSAPITGPVSGTGETLMTGSINLPRSLGMTGLHPSRYDRPDIDDLIDAVDREDPSPDSAPVRAVSAVSTYTSSQGLINARRPKRGNLPMILSITAGVMMVGVVVLVVVGMVFKIF